MLRVRISTTHCCFAAGPSLSVILLHDSLNRNRFKDKIMQQFKALQRPLRVRLDARRCSA
ncbi:hypothetical protein GHK62_23170 [Sinorhizobium terangae]|uniref:Uncharacterized protein n=1 Tax=Sinorhizobium terangae TaxID=110322 RepID=A0A6N7LJZ1_SINTE|nr:hypothetical protein [Sinorhizobium terangae]